MTQNLSLVNISLRGLTGLGLTVKPENSAFRLIAVFSRDLYSVGSVSFSRHSYIGRFVLESCEELSDCAAGDGVLEKLFM
jgi:hypothetical protein